MLGPDFEISKPHKEKEGPRNASEPCDSVPHNLTNVTEGLQLQRSLSFLSDSFDTVTSEEESFVRSMESDTFFEEVPSDFFNKAKILSPYTSSTASLHHHVSPSFHSDLVKRMEEMNMEIAEANKRLLTRIGEQTSEFLGLDLSGEYFTFISLKTILNQNGELLNCTNNELLINLRSVVTEHNPEAVGEFSLTTLLQISSMLNFPHESVIELLAYGTHCIARSSHCHPLDFAVVCAQRLYTQLVLSCTVSDIKAIMSDGIVVAVLRAFVIVSVLDLSESFIEMNFTKIAEKDIRKKNLDNPRLTDSTVGPAFMNAKGEVYVPANSQSFSTLSRLAVIWHHLASILTRLHSVSSSRIERCVVKCGLSQALVSILPNVLYGIPSLLSDFISAPDVHNRSREVRSHFQSPTKKQLSSLDVVTIDTFPNKPLMGWSPLQETLISICLASMPKLEHMRRLDITVSTSQALFYVRLCLSDLMDNPSHLLVSRRVFTLGALVQYIIKLNMFIDIDTAKVIFNAIKVLSDSEHTIVVSVVASLLPRMRDYPVGSHTAFISDVIVFLNHLSEEFIQTYQPSPSSPFKSFLSSHASLLDEREEKHVSLIVSNRNSIVYLLSNLLACISRNTWANVDMPLEMNVMKLDFLRLMEVVQLSDIHITNAEVSSFYDILVSFLCGAAVRVANNTGILFGKRNVTVFFAALQYCLYSFDPMSISLKRAEMIAIDQFSEMCVFLFSLIQTHPDIIMFFCSLRPEFLPELVGDIPLTPPYLYLLMHYAKHGYFLHSAMMILSQVCSISVSDPQRARQMLHLLPRQKKSSLELKSAVDNFMRTISSHVFTPDAIPSLMSVDFSAIEEKTPLQLAVDHFYTHSNSLPSVQPKQDVVETFMLAVRMLTILSDMLDPCELDIAGYLLLLFKSSAINHLSLTRGEKRVFKAGITHIIMRLTAYFGVSMCPTGFQSIGVLLYQLSLCFPVPLTRHSFCPSCVAIPSGHWPLKLHLSTKHPNVIHHASSSNVALKGPAIATRSHVAVLGQVRNTPYIDTKTVEQAIFTSTYTFSSKLAWSGGCPQHTYHYDWKSGGWRVGDHPAPYDYDKHMFNTFESKLKPQGTNSDYEQLRHGHVCCINEHIDSKQLSDFVQSVHFDTPLDFDYFRRTYDMFDKTPGEMYALTMGEEMSEMQRLELIDPVAADVYKHIHFSTEHMIKELELNAHLDFVSWVALQNDGKYDARFFSEAALYERMFFKTKIEFLLTRMCDASLSDATKTLLNMELMLMKSQMCDL
ncbi:hypothetical protein PCE1_003950 [Barthelona sp. PCE]